MVKIIQLFSFVGYTIPKNTIIYPALRHIMRDPDHWKEPEVFNPERFITTDEEGNPILTKEERVVTFGIGNTTINQQYHI